MPTRTASWSMAIWLSCAAAQVGADAPEAKAGPPAGAPRPAEEARPSPPERPADADETRPTQDVLQALRLLLSSDPKEEARGEAHLRRMGRAAVVPQLRYWLRKIEVEADRVRLLLESIEGTGKGSTPTEKLSANELLHRKLLEVRDLLRQGEPKSALELAEALLLLDRQGPHAWELRRLSRRARERVITRDVLEPDIEIERNVYEVGERPEVLFRLINHKDVEASIEISKGVLGEVDVTVTRCFLDGSVRRDQNKVLLQVPPDVQRIAIGPKASWERKIPLHLGHELPLQGAMARVQIAGKFRPTRWRVEGDVESLGLSLAEVELWIVPSGASDGCEKPLEKLAAALVFGDEEAFFVGGQIALWAAESDPFFNEKFIDTLLGSIEDLDTRRLALATRFLNEATGEDFEADASKWKAWWASLQK